MQVKFVKFLMAAVFAALLFSAPQLATAASTDGDESAAVIAGFRTAHFGMSESDVMKAVGKEFGLDEDAIAREEYSLEKTTSLIVPVTDLIPESGPSQIA